MRVTNPIMEIDMPDMDIIRVNDMYYMVSTTMFVPPGAPVLRSGIWYTGKLLLIFLTSLKIIPVIGWKREKNAYGQGTVGNQSEIL